MLQKIRDRITGKFALAILVVIGLSFVLFGINLPFLGPGWAAKVNGEEISAAQFENAYRNQLLALAEQGTEIPEDLRPIVREGVLDRLVREFLIDQYLDEAGFVVPDQFVTDFVQRDPTWQVDGQFSRDAYYQWLELRAIDPGVFEASQRQALEQNQLQRGIAATAFVTPADYRRYLNLYGEQRQISMAGIDINELKASIEVTDDQIAEYYEIRTDDFQAPESVDLAYVELNRNEIAEQIEIDEEELRQYYEESKSRYLQDEQRRARHILIPFGDDEAAAEEQARALAARAQAGEPFEDLARQYSADSSSAEQGGVLGLLLETQLPEGLGDAVFQMEEGDIEGPVRSDFGFHIVRLDEIRPGGPLPFADVRNELLRELRLERADANYLAVERRLSDALFDAESIADLAESSGLELKTASGFTREGGDPFGSNQAAIEAVFDPRVLDDREMSDVVELDASRSVVVAVTEYNEAARRPLEEVREQIVDDLKTERAFELANQRIVAVQQAVQNGASMESAVEGVEGVTTSTATITRQTTDVDQRIVAAAFEQKKPVEGQVRTGTVLTGDGRYVVFQVTAVAPGRPESIPLEQRDAGKEQLALQSGARDFAALVSDLEASAEIVKSEDALARETLFE